MDNSLTLVIMAAGSGTRYEAPKQLETFGKHNLTIAEYNVLDAISAGFTNFIFVVQEQMADIFHRRLANLFPSYCKFSLTYQRREKELCKYCSRTKPWGTGHAVLSAKSAIHGNFGLVNADDLYGNNAISVLADFLKAANKNSPVFANVGYEMGDTLSENGTVSRGVMSTDGNGNLIEIVENKNIAYGGKICTEDGMKFNPDTLVSMNLWGFTVKIFPILEKQWAEFAKNISNPTSDEFYLSSAVDAAAQNGECEVKVLKTSSKWRGITYPKDKIAMEKFFRND
ncbi:MAG: hypothetical protein LBS87_02935 [Puniceicoccales bacterium]|jgi:NDP-sugar pyrophosphorylase family protein|nr:hypothetical protein [Puniceicoccales bacterium]